MKSYRMLNAHNRFESWSTNIPFSGIKSQSFFYISESWDLDFSFCMILWNCSSFSWNSGI